MKLLKRIIENKLIKINVAPFNEGSSRILNSLCKVIIILYHNILYRDGINQYIGGIINNPIIDLIQFNEKLKILDVGSKTENKLVIIFNLLFLMNRRYILI